MPSSISQSEVVVDQHLKIIRHRVDERESGRLRRCQIDNSDLVPACIILRVSFMACAMTEDNRPAEHGGPRSPSLMSKIDMTSRSWLVGSSTILAAEHFRLDGLKTSPWGTIRWIAGFWTLNDGFERLELAVSHYARIASFAIWRSKPDLSSCTSLSSHS